MTGYIKIDRAILYHPALFKRGQIFCEKGAFLWLLLEASFVDRKYRIKDKEIYLKRGQLSCSQTYMAEAWGWDRSKVRRFLDKLIKYDSISTDHINDHTNDLPNIITICHYDRYQDQPKDQTKNHKHNKIINNDNNILSNFNVFWNKVNRKISKGQSQRAYSKLAEEWKSKPEALAELYNKHCSSVNEIQFSQHPSTWLNAQGYLDQEITPKPTSTDNFGIKPREDDEYLKWVPFVQKGMRSTRISDDMVHRMKKEGLITEEQFKAW